MKKSESVYAQSHIILRFCTIAFLFIFVISTNAQDPFPDHKPVFKKEIVSRIDIQIPPDSLDVILSPGNEQSDYLYHATFIFDNGTIRDTIENVGFRLRGNTSRYSQKKSFKLSFNTYEKGRKWYGLEKLNLNGEHNDPTVVRSRVCWDMLREMEVIGSRSNHIDLYINNTYFGIYVNTEHIDEEFVQLRYGNQQGNLYKCLWPADLNYLGENPDLYKLTSGDRRVYDLKTNKSSDDYLDLSEFIDVLNNTVSEDFRCELEQVFNVQSYLRAMAFDVLSGNWDGPLYNKNNFYLYHNPATDLFEYIPYDLDNTLGIDWLSQDWSNRDPYNWAHPSEPRPLFQKLMEVDEYKARYTFLLKEFTEKIFNPDTIFSKIETIRGLIAPSVQQDPYYPLDYGFDFGDFHTGFETSLPYFHTPFGLKEFVTIRRDTILDQLEDLDIAPWISNIRHNHPGESEDIIIRASVVDDFDHLSVSLCYTVDDGSPQKCVEMFDDGLHQDGAAGDNEYGVIIPAFGESVVVKYYIVAEDLTHVERQPFCTDKTLFVGSSSIPLAINELMASNMSTIHDEADEYDDWIEIYNYGNVPVYLGNRYLSDRANVPSMWPFPDLWLQAGEYLMIWADKDQDQGDLHANFKLSKDGEYVGLFDSEDQAYALIDEVSFGELTEDEAWGRFPDGNGTFQRVTPTPGSENETYTDLIKTTGINTSIDLFPNPFSQQLNISIESELFNSAAIKFELYNILGSLIYCTDLGGTKTFHDLSSLESGLYFYKINIDKKWISGHLIKI